MSRHFRPAPFFKFLNILEVEVWASFAAAFFITALMVFLFERWSPFSYSNCCEKHETEPNERFCSLKECFWFVATSMTPKGSGNPPKNLSGKLAAATWCLFGFAIVAAYAANLAACQALVRLEEHIESLEDLRGQYQVEYNVINGSAAQKYFTVMKDVEDVFDRAWKQMVFDESKEDLERLKLTVWDYPLDTKFTKMYYAMKNAAVIPDENSALEKLRKYNNTPDFALIGEAMMIKYVVLMNCDLKEVGDQFGKKSYGIAVRKGSPLKETLNAGIRKLMDQGKLQSLKRKWWEDNPARANCSLDPEINAGFGEEIMNAVFLLIGLGIVLSLFVLCLEYWYYCCHL